MGEVEHPRPPEPPTTGEASERLAPAAIADPAEFAKLCGQHVNPRAFEIEPQGNRIIVVPDPVPKKVGLIELPEDVADKEVMGQGWVLSAGPLVGIQVPYPGGPICPPSELVGRHVFFGAYIGKVLRFSIFDGVYKGRVLAMTDRDIWCVDNNPDPRAAERQFEDDLEAHLTKVTEDGEQAEQEAAERLQQERRKMVTR